jgi:MFS transporter, PAT family, beta-lactamase induction signal transducer AmpG
LSATKIDTIIPRRWAARFGPGAVYFERNVFLFFFLGFSAGIPLALSFGSLSYWLTEVGTSKGEIGLFTLLGLPYAFKFVWAPLMDGFRFPLLCRLFGRRRGWMLATQFALMAAIAIAALSNPSPGHLTFAALAALAIAFFSASQDIIIDAYRVEVLNDDQQGAGAGAYQIGYRLAMLASGAGTLIIADQLGWAAAYITMASAMLVGVITVILSPEPGMSDRPSVVGEALLPRVVEMFRGPFVAFMTTRGWFAVLVFVLFYKFGDTLASMMTGPFYLEIGFTKTQIGFVAKAVGIGATIGGAIIGGMLVYARGIVASLWICGVFQLVSNFMFVLLAMAGNDLWVLAATVGIENLAGGMGGAAFIAYMASLCHISFTATQYALLSSLFSFGRTLFAAPAGFLAETVSWEAFFSLTVLAALPGLALLWVIGKRYAPENQEDFARED